MLKVYCYSRCTTCKKALQWLDAHKKGYLILSGSEEWLHLAEGFRGACRSTRYGDGLSNPSAAGRQWG